MLKPPRYLLGAGLLFWGFQTEWFGVAVLLALLVEWHHSTKSRWDFSDFDLNRIWDLCVVLFAGALILFYASEQRATASIYRFFQWMPMFFFPMILAQVYGNRDTVPMTVFSLFLRARKPQPFQEITRLHFGYPFLATCLVSAGAANRRDIWFLAGFTILCAWALWQQRSVRFRPPVWVGSFAAVLGTAYMTQAGMAYIQNHLEGNVSAWAAQFFRRGFDADESRTSMGAIREQKSSGRIVMRVEVESRASPPLLRQAAYDTFRDPAWLTSRREFSEVPPEPDTTSWLLDFAGTPSEAVKIYTSLPRVAMLSVPVGTQRLENMPVNILETNWVGAARVMEPPGLMAMRARYQPGWSFDGEPDPLLDLHVPEREHEGLERIALELGLDKMTPDEIIATLESFFQNHFSYSLSVPKNIHRDGDAKTALGKFLIDTRQGHCEYFASATVLLLRFAGIPARYATGYAVQERSGNSSYYVVRDRHAHAWALVWRGDHWTDLDTTPGSWVVQEAQQASAFERIADWWSSLRFQILKWRWLSKRSWFQQLAPWLLAPLVATLTWRIIRGTRRAQPSGPGTGPPALLWPGLDSEFYNLERQLALQFTPRAPGEPFGRWLDRLRQAGASGEVIEPMHNLLALHYRYRFDPAGLNSAEREQLRAIAQDLAGKVI